MRVDIGKLDNILCRDGVSGEPIAVIGIAGPVRSGKSFLLSYLAQYLRFKGWSNTNWIGDDDVALKDGFSWSGGKDPHTKEMGAWSEIFKVPYKNGKELNVLLVDTPGLFNCQMTKEDDAKLFTLAVTFCSTLMLNVEKRIDQQLLESIEFFARYATGVVNNHQEDHQPDTTSSPFQHLSFVIRDWSCRQEYQFGLGGGKSYVTECFKTMSNAEGSIVQKNIRSNGRSIDGFLMPHPGLNVEEIDFQGQNRDVSAEFLRCVEELARTLFSSENLEPRMWKGELITGKDLFLKMKALDETLRDGSTPKVPTYLYVFGMLEATTASDKAFELFTEGVEQTIRSGYPSDMNDLYEVKFKECAKHYCSNATICGDDLRESYLERLTLKCQDTFAKMSQWSDFQKRQAHNISFQELNKAWIRYKRNMLEAMTKNGISDQELEALDAKYRCIALQEYKDGVTLNAAYNKDHYRSLGDLINISFSKFEKINVRRQGFVMLASIASQEDLSDQYEAQMFLNNIIEHFREEMEKFAQLYIDEQELRRQLEQLQSEFVSIFDDNWRREWPEIHPYRSDLLDVLETEHGDCIKCNTRNKDVLENIIEESLFKANEIYRNVMNQILEKGYCEPAKLKSLHEQARKDVMTHLQKELDGIEDSLTQDIFRRLETFVDSEYERLSRLNEGNAGKPCARAYGIDGILKSLAGAWSVVSFSNGHVGKVTSMARKMQANARSVKSLACSVGVTTVKVSLPQVLIGVAGTVGVAAIGYSVYRWYQERNQRARLALTQ